MNTLFIEIIKMSLIHFFNYLDYDSLLDLNLNFSKPQITKNDSYLAKLEKPIFFILPKSEILDVQQDSFGTNICRYMVNVEEHGEFLTFLDNLDSLCVNIAADYSLEWFKQKKETKQLVSRYSNTYTIDEDDHGELVTCDIEVDNLELLSDLNLYNDDDNLNILVCIDGIEFFKKTFKWKLFIDSVVDELEGEDKEEDDAFDFTNVLENREKAKPLVAIEKQQKSIKEEVTSRVNNIKKQEKQVNIETQSKLDGIDKTSIAMSEVINKEVIAELADVANIEKAKNIDIKSTLTNKDKTVKVSDKLSINELESIITQKKTESKEYLLNAERAKRASEGLYQKGMQAANEIKKYEERLQELSQTTSILSQRK